MKVILPAQWQKEREQLIVAVTSLGFSARVITEPIDKNFPHLGENYFVEIDLRDMCRVIK